ncbi:adenylate/guanylate cyclase domain-containing protein [Thalassobaculum sp. OXR-137]|uniref:adenylate/guanylate cyclase domain-containing protein n=1 Tax=Thalassobaculum sp. OXR-137 TaxID=3100173 RepID=UPI002AC89F03|nr:adenylate/guanylate cyclase domain-containing protein [Thalassobaculum sp. OXR-137]WPZ36139.1 adenylate/guanylate cyclase domain-containing protein [Thalassobaculum sp. OXR-137]
MTAVDTQRRLNRPERRISWSPIISRLRLYTGLVLFTYVSAHLVNHVAGLWSIAALDAGLALIEGVVRTQAVSILLYGSILLHMLIALRAIYYRDSLKAMAVPEVVQLALGLAIPLLILRHVLSNRLMHELYGLDDDHTWVLLNLWVFDPVGALNQSAAVLVAWGHGCTGLHLWLRYASWYDRAKPWLLSAAVLLPALSLAGFVAAGMTVADLTATPGWLPLAIRSANLPDNETIALWIQRFDEIKAGYAVVVVAAFAARWMRMALHRRSQGVRVGYGAGRSVQAIRGMTLLDVSRMHGIPHASVCGGRGRCSTCRVRVSRGLENLPPPDDAEAKVLHRISAAPNVRLACQTRVVEDLEITPLLPPHNTGMAETRGGPSYLQGRELEIAVLFADIRGFTTLSEERLPYDVVFILNRYFAEMGAAIEGAGGRIDKFIGDGIMALFGVNGDPEEGARQAVAAAREMARRLVDLNESLAGDLEAPLRIGIGLHLGPAIVGEMGYGRVRGVTAVGDTVNTASRLESLTKEFGAQLIVSDALARASGVDFSRYPSHEIEVRGRDQAMAIRVIADATEVGV